jgi:hypothetical protein
MKNDTKQNQNAQPEAMDYDPRGRVVHPRPLDRFFYDRDADRKDDAPERREYDRHRTMFWELLADYFAAGRYEEWYDLYYQKSKTPISPAEKYLTFWPGYGQKGEGFPFGDTETEAVPLKKVPGLNLPPTHKAPGHGGNISKGQLGVVHEAFDRTQEMFGAARGCYEVWTDVFVDITDGFRGGYQNGDMRWIFKTPINEEFMFVEQLDEQLYGMKDGWTWNTIAGSKEKQCAGLGSLNWGRSVNEETYIDYDESKNTETETKFGEDEHACDRNADGSQRDDVYARQVGDPNAYGVVVKEKMGPIEDETEWALTVDEVDKSTGEIWSYTKVGRTGGVTTEEFTTSKQSASPPVNRVWSYTNVGDGKVVITEDINDSEKKSRLQIGSADCPHSGCSENKFVIEEKQTADGMSTTIHGNDSETVHGNKWDYHYGRSLAQFKGNAEEEFHGLKAEYSYGSRFGLTIGGWLDVVVGIPILGMVLGGDDSDESVRAGDVLSAIGGLTGPTEIYVGSKIEVFGGGKVELGLSTGFTFHLGHYFEFAPGKTNLAAKSWGVKGENGEIAGKNKFVSAMFDIN